MTNRGPSYWLGFIAGRVVMYGVAFWLINKLSGTLWTPQPNKPQK